MFNLAFKTFGEIPLSQSKCSLQQMLLIISDGRFNKRAVCGKIHEALTCNIIPIFLIIDPLQKSGDNGKRLGIEASQSIYDLKEASWDNDNLHVKNYLDDFPFPFYAVIQSISSIPDVLTDIIRQWIELLK
jgi:midasin